MLIEQTVFSSTLGTSGKFVLLVYQFGRMLTHAIWKGVLWVKIVHLSDAKPSQVNQLQLNYKKIILITKNAPACEFPKRDDHCYKIFCRILSNILNAKSMAKVLHSVVSWSGHIFLLLKNVIFVSLSSCQVWPLPPAGSM